METAVLRKAWRIASRPNNTLHSMFNFYNSAVNEVFVWEHTSAAMIVYSEVRPIPFCEVIGIDNSLAELRKKWKI